MSDRRRIALFCGVVVLCLAGVGGYVAWTAIRGSSATAEVGSPAAIRAITAHRFLVYLTSATGEAPYDQVAIAPASDPGKGVLVGMHCDRVAMTGSVGACVEHSPTAGSSTTSASSTVRSTCGRRRKESGFRAGRASLRRGVSVP